MLRAPILLAARSDTVRRVVEKAPVSSGVVRRFVAGADVEAAVNASRTLTNGGLLATLDYLGEDTTDPQQATATVDAYRLVLGRLSDAGLATAVEVSVKLTAIGLDLDAARCLANAREIASAARIAGTTMTVDMEDHTRTDATLATVHELREDFPDVGAVVQAHLHRTETDCRALAGAGSRVRLCKGAYAEPATVAFQNREEVRDSYVRCMQVLLAGEGRPMLATHDPMLIARAGELVSEHGRAEGSYEYQMLFGIRPNEQARLAKDGHTVRVYVPYGQEWYGYLMRRLAERPANLMLLLRALSSRS